jgi:hypothetical protein
MHRPLKAHSPRDVRALIQRDALPKPVQPTTSAPPVARPLTLSQRTQPPTPRDATPRSKQVSGGADSEPPVAALHAAMSQMSMRDIVRNVIDYLISHQAFGSPLTVLADEYHRQVSEHLNSGSALHTAQSSTADGQSGGAPLGVSAVGKAITRDELQEQYLQLHMSYIRQSTELVARDERIARLCDKVTELSRTVHLLKKTIVAATSREQETPQGTVLQHTKARRDTPQTQAHADGGDAASDDESSIDFVVVAGSPFTAIDRLQALNSSLATRVEILEHNASMGWVYCDPRLVERFAEIDEEHNSLVALNAQVAAAYLELHANQDAASQRALKAEGEVVVLNKQKSQLEVEVRALRVAVMRSNVENI